MPWSFMGRRERMRRQASEWLARLNGPHDEQDRADFDRWYREGPDQAAAFDRVSALFEIAAKVRPAAVAAPAVHSQPRHLAIRYAFAVAAIAGIVLVGFAVLGAGQVGPAKSAGNQAAVFAANAHESRHVALVDGSKVVLSPGSELTIAIDGEGRRLLLTRGQARFSVVHDSRPFVVTADGTEVVALGTQFVVRLGREGTLVSLIEGRVEVSYPPARDKAPRRVTRLAPGERLIVPGRAATSAASSPASEPSLRPAMIAFDDTPLADAVEQVNGRAATRIHLGGPALADLRVTGAFRAGDPDAFAESVAAALDLELRRAGDGSLWLRSPRARPAES